MSPLVPEESRSYTVLDGGEVYQAPGRVGAEREGGQRNRPLSVRVRDSGDVSTQRSGHTISHCGELLPRPSIIGFSLISPSRVPYAALPALRVLATKVGGRSRGIVKAPKAQSRKPKRPPCAALLALHYSVAPPDL